MHIEIADLVSLPFCQNTRERAKGNGYMRRKTKGGEKLRPIQGKARKRGLL